MFDIGASNGVCVERLDVEDDGDDIQLEPQAGAKVGGLGWRGSVIIIK